MAEPQDEKPRLPLAGIFALLAMVSSFLVYKEISLQTSRPISKETRSRLFVEDETVQSRLWQDPFGAVEAHRLNEIKTRKDQDQKTESSHQLDRLIDILSGTGVPSPLRVMPVFVDGSPYSSGAETRLNDRYAVVSALGRAGYVPESGEYIRYFVWNPSKDDKTNDKGKAEATDTAIVPAELFIPRAKLRDDENTKLALVLWLKAQDFSPNPLTSLTKLVTQLNKEFGKRKIKLEWSVLGPRFSTGLSAMLQEIKNELGKELKQSDGACVSADPPFNSLKNVHFYSPWATAEDTFLLDDSPDPDASKTAREIADESCNCPDRTPGLDSGRARKDIVEKLFACAGIENFKRTIGTDAALAEHLVRELNRRHVGLNPCPEKDLDEHTQGKCNRTVALISEWDTLYGRSLPRTFAAVAAVAANGSRYPSATTASDETSEALQVEINKLRRDEWPKWISRHSYLAGLDGELPARGNGKTTDKEDDKDKDNVIAQGKGYERQSQGDKENPALRPEGRGQLDYLVRLAAMLKQEEANNGKFEAIGVLGSDVYDKLLILQALRNEFPSAIFFTTDLNARLAYPAHWASTHNLIIASHFGLQLQPALQVPIPPFRDSYQTSLFYAALMALERFVPDAQADCPDCVRLRREMNTEMNEKPDSGKLYRNTGPRLYEIGRRGAFDISTDVRSQSPHDISIHPGRPDIEAYFDTKRNLKWFLKIAATVAVLVLGVMLLSGTAADFFSQLATSKLFWLGLIAIMAAGYGLVKWGGSLPNVAESEPFALTEGISAWPTVAIRLLALAASLLFLWYSWRKMKNNENALALRFGLDEQDNSQTVSAPDKPPKPRSVKLLPRFFPGAVRCRFGLHTWRPGAPVPEATEKVDAVQLWREYTTLGDWKNLAVRALPQISIALCFGWLMMILFGFPNTPCRGESCFLINHIALALSVTLMLILIFYVGDATRLCRRWVKCLAVKNVSWPDGTLARISQERGMNKENLSEWLGIELIGERTDVIGNFIYFPFVVIVLLSLARHSYLDNWDFPVALVLIVIVNIMIVLGNAMALRRSAEVARREAIRRLESRLIPLSPETPDEARQQIDRAITAIKNNKTGAFLPFTQHPIFGAAVALPSGGYGLVLLLEYIATVQ